MTSLNEVYSLFLSSSGVATDSRKITANHLFFALKGPNFNGNIYAENAIANGACAAIVDSPEVADANEKCYFVEDVLQTLQALAQHHRNQFNIPVIALTGSNGKTTTKELLAAVLGTTHNVLATEGNLNNHIGVPLTLLRLTENHSHALIEMGANHIGEIDFLCQIAQPSHGLITNVGKAHLEGFGSEDGVLQGKTELYQFLAKKSGTVFINKEDHKLMGALGDNHKATYTPSEFTVLQDQPTLKLAYNKATINTLLVGNYNIANIAAAICVGGAFDVPTSKSIEAIEAYTPSNHRSQLLQQNNKTIVVDAYNANPTSMHAAVTAFEKRDGTKALILGFMAELGVHESEEHKTLVGLVESFDFDTCYWVGDAYKSLVKKGWFAGTEDLIKHLQNNPIDANQVLLKGSRSAGLENVLDVL